MARCLDPKKVKSAKRTLEVLEYFHSGNGEATVMDIARSMGYPQSSTSELLSCLVALGYLTRNRNRRTYKPTARVAVLGARVQRDIFRVDGLLSLLEQVARETECTVVLGNRVGLEVQYIHVCSPTGTNDVKSGYAAPLTASGLGRAMLCSIDWVSARKIVHRLNAEHPLEHRLSFDDLARECEQTRTRGYAHYKEQGKHMIAMTMQQNGEECLALGLLLSEEQFSTHISHYANVLRAAAANGSSGAGHMNHFRQMNAKPREVSRFNNAANEHVA